jgi:hypothetical protein
MAPPNQISLFDPLLVGAAATFCGIIVHALILEIIVTGVRRDLQRGRIGVRLWTNLTFVTNATLFVFGGHIIEIGLWALALHFCGAFSDIAAAFYNSAVNYTTLGDSTVAISVRWRLLGPLEAADGMLMFGVSTAMIFAVIQRLIQTRFAGDTK